MANGCGLPLRHFICNLPAPGICSGNFLVVPKKEFETNLLQMNIIPSGYILFYFLPVGFLFHYLDKSEGNALAFSVFIYYIGSLARIFSIKLINLFTNTLS